MKKAISLYICIIILLVSLPISVFAVTPEEFAEKSRVQLVHIDEQMRPKMQFVDIYSTFEEALADAQSGDIIEIFEDIAITNAVTFPQDIKITVVSGTKREEETHVGESTFVATDKNATVRTINKCFDGTLFTLGKNSNVTFENIILNGNGKNGNKGGLFYAKSSSSLTFLRSANLTNSKLGEGSFGGAIFAENGTRINLQGAVFFDNSSCCGNDIYLKSFKDISPNNITASISVCGDIDGDNAINIIDLVKIKKFFCEKNLCHNKSSAPDINCDGIYDSSDLTELIRIILDLP